MTKLIDHLEQILPVFEKWYKADHGLNEDIYVNEITQRNLSTISDKNFIKFFVEFRKEGGRVQGGGGRGLNTFEKAIRKKLKDFRKHILEPFQKKFDLTNWLVQTKEFDQWGIGIATIYLVRVNKDKYPVLNNKTIDAMKKLGIDDIKSKSISAYIKLIEIQKEMIRQYPDLKNYYKADALCHYIIAEDEAYAISKNILISSSILTEKFEQNRALSQINSDNSLLNASQIIAKIVALAKSSSESVTVTGKQFKRNIYVSELIKKLRKYTCQFCGIRIPKKDGGFYIEACHIKQKASDGNETLENILVLCPNCHKAFDLGKRKDIKHNHKKYIVEVNGVKHDIDFETNV